MNYSSPTPAFLFDLDGTLVDSVYQHVLAWREALKSCGIQLSLWRIHRRMGMSGGLFTAALLREPGRAVLQEQIEQLQRRHAQASDGYGQDELERAGAYRVCQARDLPGAPRRARRAFAEVRPQKILDFR